MTVLPELSGKEICSALKKINLKQVAQKGSHVKLKGKWKGKSRIVIVPMHKSIRRGTLQSILRQAGLTPDEFKNLL